MENNAIGKSSSQPQTNGDQTPMVPLTAPSNISPRPDQQQQPSIQSNISLSNNQQSTNSIPSMACHSFFSIFLFNTKFFYIFPVFFDDTTKF